jgi:hypothetical protein
MQNQPPFPAGMQYRNAKNQNVIVSRGGILHTDIWRSMMPDFESLNDRLLTDIMAHKADKPTIDPMANPGCWRGSSDFRDWPTLRALAIENLRAIHRHYINTGAPCAPLENIPAERFEMDYWANVNEQGSANAMHTHSKWHWSGVYYVQGTGTGEIAMYSSAYLNQQVSYGLPFGQSFTLSAEDGLLLMFPSYLLHEVLPNPSQRQRVNVAFNIKINF